MSTHSATIFFQAALDLAGLTGFSPADDNDPDHGILSFKGPNKAYIEFSRKFNGGDPMFFLTRCSKGIDPDLLPYPFKGTR